MKNEMSCAYKDKADENIIHLINGGLCRTRSKQTVFQRNNGNFYIKMDNNKCISFKGLFGSLDIAEETDDNYSKH